MSDRIYHYVATQTNEAALHSRQSAPVVFNSYQLLVVADVLFYSGRAVRGTATMADGGMANVSQRKGYKVYYAPSVYNRCMTCVNKFFKIN